MSEWIPVSERLPDDGVHIAYMVKDEDSTDQLLMERKDDFSSDWLLSVYSYGQTWNATHWMPLPEPPEVTA